LDVHSTESAYGLWPLVVINSAIFLFIAFSFWQPKTKRDWRAFGGFSTFIIALFTEMYGFPLTIYLLSGWLQKRFPGTNLLSHDFGHLWNDLIGWKGDPHLSPFHIVSDLLILGGILLLWSSWRVLLAAQKQGKVATAGPYGYIRHPQYVAFILVMLGFLVQWPTIITGVMFPILWVLYVRLAISEERDSVERFGLNYVRYAEHTPRFIPTIGRSAQLYNVARPVNEA
jgi:protein-S-isoprenylcysteine O-methyltransferase Ste14